MDDHKLKRTKSIDGLSRAPSRQVNEPIILEDAPQFVSRRPQLDHIRQQPQHGTFNKITERPITDVSGTVAVDRPLQGAKPGVNVPNRVQPSEQRELIGHIPLQDSHVKKLSFKQKILVYGQYPLLALIALAAAYSTSIGQWFVLVYALYALIIARSSQKTFVVALILLIAIPFFQIIQQPGVSENVAVYTYEFLVIGTVQAIIELIVEERKAKRELNVSSSDQSIKLKFKLRNKLHKNIL